MDSPSLFPRVHLPDLKSPAEYAFITLQEQVKAIEATLTPGEDVFGMFASFGVATTLSIRTIARRGAFFIFRGVDEEDREAYLIQHFTQLSLLLIKEKAKKPERRSIGFTAEL